MVRSRVLAGRDLSCTYIPLRFVPDYVTRYLLKNVLRVPGCARVHSIADSPAYIHPLIDSKLRRHPASSTLLRLHRKSAPYIGSIDSTESTIRSIDTLLHRFDTPLDRLDMNHRLLRLARSSHDRSRPCSMFRSNVILTDLGVFETFAIRQTSFVGDGW